MSERTALKVAEAALEAHHRAGIHHHLAHVWIHRILKDDTYTSGFEEFILREAAEYVDDDSLKFTLAGRKLNRDLVAQIEEGSLKAYPEGTPAFYPYADRAAIQLAEAVTVTRLGKSEVVIPAALADYAYEMATAIMGAGADLQEARADR